MNTTNIIRRTACLLFVGLFLAAGLFNGSPAFAAPRGRQHAIQGHAPHSGQFVGNRHGRYQRPYFRRGRRHYYPHGPFYGNRSRVSLFVGLPIGAFYPTLPYGYSSVVVHGAPYYVAGGIYYQQVLGGYRVVEAPPDVVVVTGPSVEQTSPAALPEKVQVSAAALNVRTGPGLNYSVIDEVQRGDILRVLDSASGWLNVRMESGRSGWVMDSFTIPVTNSANG
jgi:hypothetical protein